MSQLFISGGQSNFSGSWPLGLPPSDPTQTPCIEYVSIMAPHPNAPLPAKLVPIIFKYTYTFITANLD